MTRLTNNFTFEEVTESSTASRMRIDNSLPLELTSAVLNTARYMELVRIILHNSPIRINSWYRSPALNAAIKGSASSQHMKGEAVDFICPAFGPPAKIAKTLLEYKSRVQWDQLILEYTWIHISWKADPTAIQRGQVLSLLSNGKYVPGLVDPKGNPV